MPLHFLYPPLIQHAHPIFFSLIWSPQLHLLKNQNYKVPDYNNFVIID
jgi:hypothetical protein